MGKLIDWMTDTDGRSAGMEIVKVDRQGRFYLPKAIREVAGIDDQSILEAIKREITEA